MPQHRLHDFDIGTRRYRERGSGVPKGMRRRSVESHEPDRRIERLPAGVAQMQDPSLGCREHEVVRRCAGQTRRQLLDQEARYRYRSALMRLGGAEYRRATRQPPLLRLRPDAGAGRPNGHEGQPFLRTARRCRRGTRRRADRHRTHRPGRRLAHGRGNLFLAIGPRQRNAVSGITRDSAVPYRERENQGEDAMRLSHR